MSKIIIFGGSFDPIHNGHLNMARFALNKLKADKVLFMPARRTNFKTPSNIEDRVNMLRLALDNEPDFFLETYEIDSQREVNYSYDTILELKEKYKSDELYFLIGGDEVNLLHKWFEIDKLSSLIHLVAVERKSDSLKLCESNIKKYNVEVLEGFDSDVSSSDIRKGKSLYTKLAVIEYIVRNELYFIPKVKRYLSLVRYEHSLSVARTAFAISVSNNLEPSKAYLAGLLHDVGKYVKVEGELKYEIDKKYSHFFYDKLIPNWAYHQFIGEKIVREDFGIEDKDILNSILYHTTGHEDMSNLEKIIFASDKIEPTRGFDSSDLIKAMKEDVSNGFIKVLEANREYLKAHNSYIKNQDELTDSCYQYYLKGR